MTSLFSPKTSSPAVPKPPAQSSPEVMAAADAERRRQLAAELTSRQLRLENEERRSAEARLKVADERLNLAFDSTQVGVYEWDVETDQVYCTPSIWKLIGYDPSEMPTTGSGWLNLLHGEEHGRATGSRSSFPDEARRVGVSSEPR